MLFLDMTAVLPDKNKARRTSQRNSQLYSKIKLETGLEEKLKGKGKGNVLVAKRF